jgi:hypothetical protein
VIDLCRNEPLTLWGLFSFFTCELGLPLKAESPTNVRSVGLTHRRISVVGSNHKGQTNFLARRGNELEKRLNDLFY